MWKREKKVSLQFVSPVCLLHARPQFHTGLIDVCDLTGGFLPTGRQNGQRCQEGRHRYKSERHFRLSLREQGCGFGDSGQSKQKYLLSSDKTQMCNQKTPRSSLILSSDAIVKHCNFTVCNLSLLISKLFPD